jgi:hypothetical protein
MIQVGGRPSGGTTEVRFNGRNRAETKRKALAWWVANRDELKLSIAEFLGACSITADGTAMTFKKPEEKKESAFRLFAKRFSRA